jgi:hypothetical protein
MQQATYHTVSCLLSLLDGMNCFLYQDNIQNHKQFYYVCTVEFLDNGATLNISLVSQGVFPIILKTRTPFLHLNFYHLKKNICPLWCMYSQDDEKKNLLITSDLLHLYVYWTLQFYAVITY